MARKENKVGMYLKNRLEDIVDLTENVGLVGIIDFLLGFSIDNPLGDIATGAGLQAGDALSSGKTYRLVSSTVAVGLSMCPDFVQLAESGDAETFLKGAGVKALNYMGGIIIGGLLNELIRSNYDGIVEVNAFFRNETEANKAFEYVKGVIKIGDYVRRFVSSVDDLQQIEDGYLLHAIIVDKTSKIQKYLKPSLEDYFSKTMEPLETKISDVVKIRGNNSFGLLALLKIY